MKSLMNPEWIFRHTQIKFQSSSKKSTKIMEGLQYACIKALKRTDMQPIVGYNNNRTFRQLVRKSSSESKWVLTTSHCSGWFPLSRNFSVRTRVKLTCVNEVVAMYVRLLVNVKAEGDLTFMFTRDLPYIASILCTSVRITRQQKSTLKQ